MNSFSTKSHKAGKELGMKEVMELDIESLMSKLDGEKRESDYLDEVIKSQESEISSLKARKKSEYLKNPLLSKLVFLEKQIEYQTAQYDALKSENSSIRKEIDHQRLENSAYKKSLNSLKIRIQSSSSTAIQFKQLNKIGTSSVVDNHNKIVAIRSRSVLNKQRYQEKIKDLSLELNQKYSGPSNSRKNIKLEQLLGSLKGCNAYRVQTELYPRWDKSVRDKKQELESFIKHILRLKNGFEEIRTAFGISKVEDIVTSCIKTEDQNSSLYKYLSNLNEEIEEVTEKLKTNLSKIEYLKSLEVSEDKQKEKLLKLNSKLMDTKQNTVLCIENTYKIRNSISAATCCFIKIHNVLTHFHGTGDDLVDFEIDSNDKLQEFLNSIDLMIENFKAALNFSNKTHTFRYKSTPKLQKTPNLSFVLDQKDLYVDADIEDLKFPMKTEDFSAKAEKILKTLK
jgi:hypothetical protein